MKVDWFKPDREQKLHERDAIDVVLEGRVSMGMTLRAAGEPYRLNAQQVWAALRRLRCARLREDARVERAVVQHGMQGAAAMARSNRR